MSNVASRDLCKELYELSGWDGTLIRHGSPTRMIDAVMFVRTVYDKFVGLYESSVGCDECEGEHAYGFATMPAYDLGYLLRKLPHFIDISQLSGGYTPNGWAAIKRLSQDFPFDAEARADTPEDALCQLAIELFKQGVLKKQ